MRIFVTGGSGFIGYNLVKRLCADGHDVGITNVWDENNQEQGRLPEKFGRSIRNLSDEATSYHDVLYHQAAYNDTQSDNKEEMFQANVYAPMVLFTKFADAGCKRFIYASSTAVYGNSPAPYDESNTPLDPLTTYAQSKAEFDQWAMKFAHERNVNVLGLRYCNVYGPGEAHKRHRSSMIRQMIIQISVGKRPQIFWDGNQKRDWCYVKDVVRANLLALQFQGADIVNIGFGRSWTFHQVVDIINKQSKQWSSPQYIPNPFPQTYQSHVECSIDKARKLIGYNPLYDINSGIEDYFREWS